MTPNIVTDVMNEVFHANFFRISISDTSLGHLIAEVLVILLESKFPAELIRGQTGTTVKKNMTPRRCLY